MPSIVYTVRHFRKIFPEKVFKMNRKFRPRKEWVTKGLINSCIKNKLYKKYKITGKLIDKENYNNYRNTLTKLLKLTEKSFYADKFRNVSNNLRKTWSILNRVINKTSVNDTIKSLNIDGNKVIDPNIIVTKLNDYFTNIGPSLAAFIKTENRTYDSYLTKNHPNSFVMYPTDPNEIINIVSNLKNKASYGYDNIPTTIIKSSTANIAHPLTAIINKSILTGCFLDSLKIAKICQIFKSGDSMEISNYRPISLLPCLSKIFEKVISIHLISYLEKYQILTPTQYGFRNNHSTSMPLLDIYDKISKACDDNLYSIGVFIDLSKAFDTINHNILIDKLRYYGIRGIPLELFRSYLSNRKQFVAHNVSSSFVNNICRLFVRRQSTGKYAVRPKRKSTHIFYSTNFTLKPKRFTQIII